MEVPSHIEAEIKAKVASGRYDSAADVLQKALDVLEEVESAEADIRAKVKIGLDQLDRGEGIPAEDVFAELRERNKQARNKHGA